MIVNMLHNWNHKYYSHYKIIKYVGFKSVIYANNVDGASSFKFFSEFDSKFISNVLLI